MKHAGRREASECRVFFSVLTGEDSIHELYASRNLKPCHEEIGPGAEMERKRSMECMPTDQERRV